MYILSHRSGRKTDWELLPSVLTQNMFHLGVITVSLLHQTSILGQGQEKTWEYFFVFCFSPPKNQVYVATDPSSFILALLGNNSCPPPLPNCSGHKWCKGETLERWVLCVHYIRDNAIFSLHYLPFLAIRPRQSSTLSRNLYLINMGIMAGPLWKGINRKSKYAVDCNCGK